MDRRRRQAQLRRGTSLSPAERPAPQDVADREIPQFPPALTEAVQGLQRTLATMLRFAAGSSESATELARALKIEPTLAWRVWRFVHADSSAEAASFVIGPTALEGLLTVSARNGVDRTLTQAVREAHRGYREFVSRCAGDEATLRMMVGAVHDPRAGAALADNRLLFDGSRLRLGVQVASQLRCCIMFPSELEGISSAADIDVFSDVWWLRRQASAVLRLARVFHTQAPRKLGAPIPHLAAPLDPELARLTRDAGNESLVPLLPAFSHGQSTAVCADQVAGTMVYSITPRAVGRDLASTLCFGELHLNHILPLAADPQWIFSTATLVPSELVVLEVYVHRALVQQGYEFRPMIADDLLFRSLEAGFWAPRFDVAALGGTFVATEPTPSIDNPIKLGSYRELLQFAFSRVGFARRDFFCYRLRIPLPAIGLRIGLVAGQEPSDGASEPAAANEDPQA